MKGDIIFALIIISAIIAPILVGVGVFMALNPDIDNFWEKIVALVFALVIAIMTAFSLLVILSIIFD